MDCKSNRLGCCEVCATTEAKYTCPRCEVKTCCLTCVNIHKKELECDGMRNKVYFKRLHQFSNLDLLSDYRLLEDVTRSYQKIHEDPKKYISRFIPRHLLMLGREARNRGMRLHFLPRNFKKAKENTSYYNVKSRSVWWRIEWYFPQADVRLVSERIPETTRLAEALCVHLEPDLCKDDNLKSKMPFYYSAGVSGVHALLRVGEMEKNRYHMLDLHSNIRSNLIRKSIIEFPVITVVLKDHVYAYDLYDSDEEVEQWRGDWETNISKREMSSDETLPEKKSKQSDDKNFLFANDDSSEDE